MQMTPARTYGTPVVGTLVRFWQRHFKDIVNSPFSDDMLGQAAQAVVNASPGASATDLEDDLVRTLFQAVDAPHVDAADGDGDRVALADALADALSALDDTLDGADGAGRDVTPDGGAALDNTLDGGAELEDALATAEECRRVAEDLKVVNDQLKEKVDMLIVAVEVDRNQQQALHEQTRNEIEALKADLAALEATVQAGTEVVDDKLENQVKITKLQLRPLFSKVAQIISKMKGFEEFQAECEEAVSDMTEELLSRLDAQADDGRNLRALVEHIVDELETNGLQMEERMEERWKTILKNFSATVEPGLNKKVDMMVLDFLKENGTEAVRAGLLSACLAG